VGSVDVRSYFIIFILETLSSGTVRVVIFPLKYSNEVFENAPVLEHIESGFGSDCNDIQ